MLEKNKITPSKYYDAIEDAYLNSKSNIFVNASAGSGKTTSLLKLANQTSESKKVIFLAFNKSIQEELRLKLPNHIEVSTLHAKAYGILRSNVKMNAKINELKNFIYCRQVIKRKFKDKKKENSYYFSIAEIINFMKLNLISVDEIGINKVCNDYGLTASAEQIEDIISVMNFIEKDEINLNKSKMHNIDFTDMLYLCVNKVNSALYPKYDIVFTDETQDFNVCQQRIALSLLKPKGRLISVGDEKQAINNFCGSSLETFEFFKNRENTVCLPLPISYRLPSSGVEASNKIFPGGTEERPNAILGEVRDGVITEAKNGDMIVCRNNKPLIQAWLELMKVKKKAHIMGKDFGKNLKVLIDRIDGLSGLDDLIKDKYDELKDKGVDNPLMNNQYVSLKEKCDIIKTLYCEFGTLNEVGKTIDEIFSNDKNGIILTTIHRSKGLEANTVFILNWSLIPSKYAFSEGELYAEKCLQYVAVTRHKELLVFAEIEDK